MERDCDGHNLQGRGYGSGNFVRNFEIKKNMADNKQLQTFKQLEI